jgi:hypothetical protein
VRLPRKLGRREDRTRGQLGLRRRAPTIRNFDHITTTGFPRKKLCIPVASASFVSLPRFRRSIIVKFRESVEIRPGTDSMQTRRIPYWISDLDPTVSLLDHRCHRLKSEHCSHFQSYSAQVAMTRHSQHTKCVPVSAVVGNLHHVSTVSSHLCNGELVSLDI